MIDRAFSECSTGILQAQEKCLGVIEALGTVYLQARDVLDRINPERWAPHSHVALHKRQVIPGNRYVMVTPGTSIGTSRSECLDHFLDA